MKNNKTEFKYFTVPQYRKEENYLSDMNEKGWRFVGVSFPGLYHFEKCDPAPASYRLDYNQEGQSNKGEYIQMFKDCGWDYICDFVGYSYFRKDGQVGEEREEIFCDEASRLDMMKRVFQGRIFPLIIIFTAIILPQLYMNTSGYYGNTATVTHDIFSFIFLGLALLYLTVFTATGIQLFEFEKKVTGNETGIRKKYIGLIALVVLILTGVGLLYWSSYRSIYTVTDTENGYVVAAQHLNKSIEKAYDLKKGDTVEFRLAENSGRIHLSLGKDGKEPVFFGDFFEPVVHEYTINEDGHYIIEVSGRRAEGSATVTIK